MSKPEEDKDPRSKEEVAAELEKTKAETKKIVAECRKAESEALKSELEARAAYRKWELEEARDEENFLYRFAGDVTHSSVSSCMKKLTQWHRLNPNCDIEIIFSSPGGSIIDGF